MYQFAGKETAAAVKRASSGKRKKPASGRRRVFNSFANQRDRQASENRISSPPIVTAMAPRADDQYSAGAAGLPVNEWSPDDLGFIEYVLENNWREFSGDREITARIWRILQKWNEFLPKFLEYHGFISHGENQSRTFHRTGPKETAGSPDHSSQKGMSKIEEIYSGTSNIRVKREYTDDEAIKRYLRHCAAALAINFGIEDELQCYHDDGIVYVAANNAGSGISKINGMKVSECSAILQYSWRKLMESQTAHDNHPIWGGFHDKLDKLVAEKGMSHPLLDRLEQSISCPPSLSDAAFQVIENNCGIRGLHAERQLLYYLRDQKGDQGMFLDPLRLGGIRRPCFICSALCFADMSQVHPGPVWVSGAASKPKDVNEMFLILEAIRNKNNTTYITQYEIQEERRRLFDNRDTESEGG